MWFGDAPGLTAIRSAYDDTDASKRKRRDCSALVGNGGPHVQAFPVVDVDTGFLEALRCSSMANMSFQHYGKR